MKKKMKQWLTLWVTGTLLVSLLSVPDRKASKAADISRNELGETMQTGHGLQNPRTDNGVTTWDCIYFGNYWQEDNNGDGNADKNDDKTPIKWRVLSVDGDDAFLLADKNLDCQTYNSQNWQINWGNCTMRSWLNGYRAEENKVGMDYSGNGFLDNAFTESECQAIKDTDVVNSDNPTYGTAGGDNTSDKVYLLSLDELTDPAYGFISSTDVTDTRQAVNTAYTAAGGEIQGVNMSEEGRTAYWWSRSPGRNSSAAVLVHADGRISDIYLVNYEMCVVRPALHLNLSALPDSWSKAGTVTAGKPIVTPTPTQKPTPTPTSAGTPVPTTVPTGNPTPAATASAEPAPDDLLAFDIMEINLDGIVKFVIPQQMTIPANTEKIASVLPRQVTVIWKNGRSAVLPAEGTWVYDASGACWRNSVDTAKLPSDLTKYARVLSDISVDCEVADDQGLIFEMCGDSPAGPELADGTEGKIMVKRNPTSGIGAVDLYQITKQNGIYTSDIRFSTALDGVTEDVENHTFVIPATYFSKDTGDYVAVGYQQWGGKTAYLSDAIIPLLVAEKNEGSGNSGKEDFVGGNGNTSEEKDSGAGSMDVGSAGGNGEISGGNNTTDTDSKKYDTEASQDNKTTIPKVAKVSGLKGKVKAKGKRKSLDLTWKKVSGAGGYQVQISTKKSFKGAKKITVKKSKRRYKTSRLKKKKKYYVRVRAWQNYKTEQGKAKKAYGKWRMIRI